MDSRPSLPTAAGRWILVPILSIVAFPVVFLLAAIASRLLSFFMGPTALSDNFFDYVVAPGVAGFYSVQLAGMVAPSAKKAAALAIAAVLTATYGFVAVLALVMGTWPIALATIPAVIGSGKAAMDGLA